MTSVKINKGMYDRNYNKNEIIITAYAIWKKNSNEYDYYATLVLGCLGFYILGHPDRWTDKRLKLSVLECIRMWFLVLFILFQMN